MKRMIELIPGIRNAVRAVIVRDDALLVQHKRYADESRRYTLPGGAPELGETLEAGLLRECREELGVEVELIDLMFVADYYKLRETKPPTRRQQVEFLFRCGIPDGYQARNGPKPDKHQVDVIWLPLAEIPDSLLHPPGLELLLTGDTHQGSVYRGLIE